MVRTLIYIISIIANAVYFSILKKDLYTDRYHLPDGETGVHTRSPIESLYTAELPITAVSFAQTAGINLKTEGLKRWK